MPILGIEFTCESEEEAESRVEAVNEDDETMDQKVTSSGNYYREVNIPQRLYDVLLSRAEEDEDAYVKKVEIV